MSWNRTDGNQLKANYFATKMVLRCLGMLDILAMVAVLAPRAWLDQLNKWCGLGPLPADPIVGYLVRSSSLLYALYGAIILFVSFDPSRYRPLIWFMAWAAIVHGVIMFGIDVTEGLPLWWRCAEGPGFSATGVIVLWSLPRISAESQNNAI